MGLRIIAEASFGAEGGDRQHQGRLLQIFRHLFFHFLRRLIQLFGSAFDPPLLFQRSAHQLFHHRLVIQAGAYQNSTWVVAVAKAGVEDGHALIGGSIIVNPDGVVVAESSTESDELIVHACDLDDTDFGKTTVFDFARHRRTEHYSLICTRTGVLRQEI